MNRQYLFLLAITLSMLSGCQQSVSDRLAGDWLGQPDTSAATAERTAKVKSELSESAEAEISSGVPTANAPSKTDIEHHAIAIRLSFASDKTATMSLEDGSQKLEGVWRVVTTLPPDGAEIEISISSPHDEDSQAEEANEKESRNEKRRFIIDFQHDDGVPGFTLVEKGADPQFGRLYFSRK